MTSASVERVRWHHPEWAAAAVATAVWALLLVPPGGQAAHAGHAGHAAHGQSVAGVTLASGWLLMSVAMMVPSALPAARYLALTAMWRRRQRTIVLFLTSYLAIWVGFGAVALPAAEWARRLSGLSTAGLLVGVLVIAAAWELTPWKRRSLRACHLIRPVPPRGRKADAGCIRAGLVYGLWCIVGCWALMLTMAVAGHANLLLMVFLTLIVAVQKILVIGTRLGGQVAVLLVGAAALVIAV